MSGTVQERSDLIDDQVANTLYRTARPREYGTNWDNERAERVPGKRAI